MTWWGPRTGRFVVLVDALLPRNAPVRRPAVPEPVATWSKPQIWDTS